MVAEIFGGISALKASLDIAKSLKDMNDVAVRKGVAVELREQILTAQEEQAALIEQVSELKTKLASFEKWETEKDRYELERVGSGAFAYVLKADAANGEPPHWLCANCYQDRKKRLLQYSGHGPPGPDYSKNTWKCPDCGSQIMTSLAAGPKEFAP